METNYNNERRLFKTECKIMSYDEYLNSKYNAPFVDIGHFEGMIYKSDIKIWLNGSVTMEVENGELRLYAATNCYDFSTFIIDVIHKARFIMLKYALDEFTYNSFVSSIKYLFETTVPDNIVLRINHRFTEEVNIPITNDKRDLKLLMNNANIPEYCAYPLVKYTSSNNSVFYITKNGNVVVDSTCTVHFDEFEKVMKIASLVHRLVMVLPGVDVKHSRYFNELIDLISEKQ